MTYVAHNRITVFATRNIKQSILRSFCA